MEEKKEEEEDHGTSKSKIAFAVFLSSCYCYRERLCEQTCYNRVIVF